MAAFTKQVKQDVQEKGKAVKEEIQNKMKEGQEILKDKQKAIRKEINEKVNIQFFFCYILNRVLKLDKI